MSYRIGYVDYIMRRPCDSKGNREYLRGFMDAQIKGVQFNFGDEVVLKDGFKGKITGRTNSNPAYYDVTDNNHKRINGIPEANICTA